MMNTDTINNIDRLGRVSASHPRLSHACIVPAGGLETAA
jgi:hypothetical protein